MMSSNPDRADKAAGGVLLLDKPAGMSSNAALQRVRRAFRRIKAGHTGTLDPMATGLLPVCLGEATKFARGLLNADKTYEASLRLGTATDSGDAEGDPIFHGDVAGIQGRLIDVLEEFRGEFAQTPPMYSAIKHRGRPLYEYARQGQQVERTARPVRVYELSVMDASLPNLGLRVRCSKGTYIRSLAHDIGLRLGCGAHLVALRRTAVGKLGIEDAVSFDVLESVDEVARWSRLLAPDVLLSHLPAVFLSSLGASSILQGKVVSGPEGFSATGEVRLYDETGLFLGMGSAGAGGQIIAKRMCSREVVSQGAGLRNFA